MTPFGKRDVNLTPFTALVEPLRRRLFLYLASAAAPVGRDEAAAALGVARSVAAFHLDKLAAAGVVTVEYGRRSGRTGPGAGRPAKLYRAVEGELIFSVPERRYELAAAILAQAVADAEEESISVAEALEKAARTFGRTMGADSDKPGGPKDSLERVADVLIPYGYLPCIGPDQITLTNCPYHSLATEHRAVVCGMNLRLIKGVLKGAGAKDLSARFDRSAGHCCVSITAR